MKTGISIYSLVLVVALILAALACQPAKRIGAERSAAADSTVSRGFNPLEFASDDEVVPAKYPRNGKIIGHTDFVLPDSLAGGSAMVLVDVPDEIDTIYNQVYKVQLFTSKVYGETRQTVRVAEEIFDRPVSIDYEVPYYKVRVGMFSDRDEAEEYAQRAKGAGYSLAWVVVVNINVKEAAPLYKLDQDRLPADGEESGDSAKPEEN
jgi:hypothetical protein